MNGFAMGLQKNGEVLFSLSKDFFRGLYRHRQGIIHDVRPLNHSLKSFFLGDKGVRPRQQSSLGLATDQQVEAILITIGKHESYILTQGQTSSFKNQGQRRDPSRALSTGERLSF